MASSHTHTHARHVLFHSELDHGLSEPQIRCITHQMLLALECLHSNGCIHRDLKAGNILLCSDGSIRLGECTRHFSVKVCLCLYTCVYVYMNVIHLHMTMCYVCACDGIFNGHVYTPCTCIYMHAHCVR